MTILRSGCTKIFLILLIQFSLLILPLAAQKKLPVPRVDLHVHLSDNLSIRQAVELSISKEVQFGIVEHPGLCEYWPIRNDSLLHEYITMLRLYPVYVGLQPVVPGWRELFSPEVLAELDYIIMDAMEIPQADGSILRLWMDADLEVFMEMYSDYTVEILSTQGIDLLANATFLPKGIEEKYTEAWMPDRTSKIINATIANGVTFEINSYYKVPRKKFIQQAKAACARFSFGTNSIDDFAGTMDYALQMVKECGLDSSDIFVPGRK